ncbi:MAG: acyl CoA transferase/carnitine dehydratase [Bacteroidetes bacterium OLB12]|nr:MAG: acyl CoA transferase/carnitine dehydratase [Bacteroidetes bacterium OLB12]HNR73537.1 CoA transferase [Cyclobacteriaceae bacterium]HNU41796.1 CoA transferase [Cyclobacteriaceae bacterium]
MFQGIKVLELASVLAGPSVGQFFAELGAEVIKVENLKTGGDVTRTWRGKNEDTDDRSAYFCSVNWGKKSVALDLSTPLGKSAVQKLAQQSAIIIASYKPGDAEKLGVSYQQLSTDNTQLIYGQITGYGSANDRVGYDAVIQAESGFMDLNGSPEGPPTKMPVALIDVLAAHHLKEGLLIALLKKDRTGEGSLVEVSLFEAAISSLANQASNWLVARQQPKRQGSEHPNIAPYGETFLTKDGKRVLLAIGSDRQFLDLLQVLGLPIVADDNRFKTNQSRVLHRAILHELLTNAIAKFEANTLMNRIHSKKIPAGIIQSVDQVLEMKDTQRILLEGNNLRGVRNFVGSNQNASLLPPPHFGEHTKEVLDQLQLKMS